ncbi:MAG: efflux RND transporter periplasmic adaptor subunit [Phycisphaerales bacterium]
MKRSSIIAGVGLFVFLGVVAGGLTLRKRAMIAAAAAVPSLEPPMSVEIATVGTAHWQPTTELVGTVIALKSVSVRNEVEGVVKRVGFESASIVEPGQVLVELNDETERAELQTAQAAVRVAEAEVAVAHTRERLAETELARQESAAASKAVSDMQLDRSRAEAEQMRAERQRSVAAVDEARARVVSAEARLEKLVIRAPFRGRVGLRNVHVGQFLTQQMGDDSDPIAMLMDVSDVIYVDFAVPQEMVGRAQVGMVVQGMMEGRAEPVRLEVAAVDATADAATRNVRVRAVVDNRDGLLRQGMFVKVRVPVEVAREYVVVPVEAVRRASYADQVFVVTEVAGPGEGAEKQLRAQQRFVKLGPVAGAHIIVIDGVKPGEKIAASGSFKLRDGALVMAAPPAAPAPAPGPASKGG